MVHDIGKLRIPEAIVNKPGRLTDDEFELMKQHAAEGGRMVECLGDPALAAAVRSHHERWDGSGYPDGLSGEQIPLEARIISVVDTFDAIASERFYRAATPHAKVLRIIDEEAGKQFDPDAARAFISCYSDRRGAALWAAIASVPRQVAERLSIRPGEIAGLLGAAVTASLVVVAGVIAAEALSVTVRPAGGPARRQPAGGRRPPSRPRRRARRPRRAARALRRLRARRRRKRWARTHRRARARAACRRRAAAAVEDTRASGRGGIAGAQATSTPSPGRRRNRRRSVPAAATATPAPELPTLAPEVPLLPTPLPEPSAEPTAEPTPPTAADSADARRRRRRPRRSPSCRSRHPSRCRRCWPTRCPSSRRPRRRRRPTARTTARTAAGWTSATRTRGSASPTPSVMTAGPEPAARPRHT